MSGGWIWLAQWAREIRRKREERAEQRESFKKKRLRNLQAGGHELHRIKLAADEKEKLRAKIAERPQRIARSKKMRMVVCLYMAIMIFGVMGSAFIIFIYQDTFHTIESVKSLVSCLIVIVFCISWLKLSNIRKSRGLPATILGVILFILGSGLVGFGVTSLYPKSIVTAFLSGVPALVASYFLCFGGSENND
jgi:Na+/melibiose symporter-like transporter